MLLRRPASVTWPGTDATSSSCAAVTWTSSRRRSSWFGPIAQHPVEDLAADRHQVGVGHPGAVEAVAGLALLVLPHLREGPLVDLAGRVGWG